MITRRENTCSQWHKTKGLRSPKLIEFITRGAVPNFMAIHPIFTIFLTQKSTNLSLVVALDKKSVGYIYWGP